MTTISSIPASRTSSPPPTSANKKPVGKKKDNQNKIKVGIAALVLLLLGGAAWAFWPMKMPKPGTPEAIKFAATDKFQGLSADQKKPYTDAFEKMNGADRRKAFEALSDAEREKLFSGFGNRMEKEALDYLKKSPADKQKFINDQIDREEKWAAERAANGNNNGQGGPGGPGGQGGRNRGGMGDAARMKGRLENSSPIARAAMAQMRADMAKARADRGLPARGGGPGGR